MLKKVAIILIIDDKNCNRSISVHCKSVFRKTNHSRFFKFQARSAQTNVWDFKKFPGDHCCILGTEYFPLTGRDMNDDSNNISVLIFQEITITSFGTTVSVSHILFIFCKGKGIFCCKFTMTDLCNIDFFMWSYTNCWQILCESCVHCHVIRVQLQSNVIRIGNYGPTIYMYSVYYSSS